MTGTNQDCKVGTFYIHHCISNRWSMFWIWILPKKKNKFKCIVAFISLFHTHTHTHTFYITYLPPRSRKQLDDLRPYRRDDAKSASSVLQAWQNQSCSLDSVCIWLSIPWHQLQSLIALIWYKQPSLVCTMKNGFHRCHFGHQRVLHRRQHPSFHYHHYYHLAVFV